MPAHNPPDVTSAEEFNEALTALLDAAHTNGVSVRGGWTCPINRTAPTWDVVITDVDTSGG